MEDGDTVLDLREALLEAVGRLRGQGDLGHEDDGPLPRLDGVLDRLEIDLRLAAAGDAVEEDGTGFLPACEALGGSLDLGQRGGLLFIEDERRRFHVIDRLERIARDDAIDDTDEAALLQRLQRGARDAEIAGELRQPRRAAHREERKRLLLPRLPRAEAREEGLVDRREELHRLFLLPLLLLAARGFRQHRADHRLDRSEVKGRDPLREFHQPRSEKGIVRDRAEDGLEPVFQSIGLDPLDFGDRADGAAVAQGHAHPLPDPSSTVSLGLNR